MGEQRLEPRRVALGQLADASLGSARAAAAAVVCGAERVAAA